jgi:hypothetical protein
MIEKIYDNMESYLNKFFPYIKFEGELYHNSFMFTSDRYEVMVVYHNEHQFYGILIRRYKKDIYVNRLPNPAVIEETMRVLASCSDIKTKERDYKIDQMLKD